MIPSLLHLMLMLTALPLPAANSRIDLIGCPHILFRKLRSIFLSFGCIGCGINMLLHPEAHSVGIQMFSFPFPCERWARAKTCLLIQQGRKKSVYRKQGEILFPQPGRKFREEAEWDVLSDLPGNNMALHRLIRHVYEGVQGCLDVGCSSASYC